ncbi:hypothetical protein Ahia01_000928800 [Argonauta hians]
MTPPTMRHIPSSRIKAATHCNNKNNVVPNLDMAYPPTSDIFLVIFTVTKQAAAVATHYKSSAKTATNSTAKRQTWTSVNATSSLTTSTTTTKPYNSTPTSTKDKPSPKGSERGKHNPERDYKRRYRGKQHQVKFLEPTPTLKFQTLLELPAPH